MSTNGFVKLTWRLSKSMIYGDSSRAGVYRVDTGPSTTWIGRETLCPLGQRRWWCNSTYFTWVAPLAYTMNITGQPIETTSLSVI